MSIPVIARNFPVSPERLLPQSTADSEPFWRGLKEGKLLAQRCAQCRRQRWPVAPVCPFCGATEFAWDSLPARGEVFSFIRYRRSFLPEFEDLMPYSVVTAQLGPDVRMYGRVIDEKTPLRIGAKLEVILESWPDDWLVPAFRLTE